MCKAFSGGFSMKKRTFCVKTLTVCLLAVLLFGWIPAAAFAEETSPQTVKVGFYYDSDYFYRDKQGNYCGYDVEYLYELSKYTGWRYRYVRYDSFEDAYTALEAGKVDILPSLFYSEERAQKLLLSDYDMGSIYVTLVVSPTNSQFAYGDDTALKGKRVGILAGALDGKEYVRWEKLRGLNTENITMSSTKELLDALDRGELDAVAISYLGASSPYRIVNEFSPMKLHFGMPRDHTALMRQLNEAMGKIVIETPDFANSLYSRYYLANQKQTPIFTDYEKKYIASAKTLKVALPESNAPFSYVGSDGAIRGAVVDYYRYLAKLSGLTFSFKGYPNITQAVQAVQKGKADIAGSLVYDAVQATAEHVLLTNAYLDTAITQVTLRGTKEVKRAAVPTYLIGVYESRTAENDGVTVHKCETSAACMQALKNGTADSAVMSTYSANYYMNNGRAGSYNVTTLNGATYQVAAGLPFSADRTLYSILNRCIRFSNSTTMSELIVKHSQADNSSIHATINRIPQYWLAAIAAVMLCSVVILMILLMGLKRRQREKDAVAAQKLLVSQRESQLLAVERAAEEKNRFFSNIGHDMRTPLNAVLGFVRLAKDEEISEDQRRDYLEKIESSGNLLLDLINDTLTLSKGSSGKMELRPEPVNLELLKETVGTPVRTIAGEKGIALSLDESACRPRTVLADKLVLEKILLNLLNNAVKYTPSGGHIWVSVREEPLGGADPDTVISVRDNGIGISESYLPHLFEPFSQERQLGYESVGTGLGLSIVRQLVDLMGGTISVKSELGRGSEFIVRLHFPETEEPVRPESAESGVDGRVLAGRRVLLCEDNQMNREIAAALLTGKNMRVDAVENGLQGVERFSAAPSGTYDLILMDIRMPVMDGYEAAEKIRGLSHADAASVPIIALTADAFPEDILRAREAGMTAHLAKPIDPGRMFAVIAEALSGNGKKQNRQ
jgi:signal transduction histidine kinase/ABC-type amino acid transport substrate-binding protein/ActR/RegA family two-component response regulator